MRLSFFYSAEFLVRLQWLMGGRYRGALVIVRALLCNFLNKVGFV